MKVFAVLFLCLGSALARTEFQQTCEGKADRGMCLAYMPMYYYNADTDTCERFIYGGCQGNGNRYATKEECEEKCKGYSQKTEDDDVCNLPPVTGPCRAYFPMYYFDANSGTCKKMVYGGCGGNGNRFVTENDCLSRCSVLDAEQREKSCEGKGETGLCDAYFPMYYYDAETGTCKRFVYGGCGGNNNRYSTEAECLQNCRVVKLASKDICSLEPETGPCRARIPKFYYDSETGECKSFIYGGCGGNENRFNTPEECQSACAVARLPSKNCEEEPETGPCHAFFTRYYYDKNSNECKSFVYGGCRGNGNNYVTKESCEDACK